MLNPKFLRCEYLINPLGIDVLNPRLSWILESTDRSQKQKQTAYHILVASSKEILEQNKGDIWDTNKVTSDKSIHIEYKGSILESSKYYYWKVKVWDKDDNMSDWSQSAFWSMGLLKRSDWKAKWIGPPPKKISRIRKKLPKKYDPLPLLRKNFEIMGKIKRAIVYVTALGEYELYLNGKRVGDHLLAPEWTDYDFRVQYQTYDVTDLVREGENIIGAILADGWYMGNLGPGLTFIHHYYGNDRRLLMQMSVEQVDGKIEEIITDSDWKILENGPIESSDHFMGETYNMQKEPEGWDRIGFDDSIWSSVTVDLNIKKKMVSQMNEPIRKIKEIKPIEVSEPKPGVFIFNLGQNIAGWCKIKLDENVCEENATIILRHGEMLNPDGTLYTKNLRRAKAIDKYILKNNKERVFHPHFTYHGFQYVEVTGLKKGIKPDLDLITGCAISSDVRRVSSFECSDDTANKLWKNILWTQIDNLISVPTDCPQRNERMGWMGDAQVFCQTSIFNMDMAAFYTKWIQDIRDGQYKNGKYPDMVPDPMRKSIIGKIMNGAPAWTDCGIILPWDVYLNYDDKKLIETHYKSAKRLIDFIKSKNPNLIWKKSRGFNYNDWLNGDKIKTKGYPRKGAEIPKDIFSTAFFAHSTEILSKMANVIGLEKDSKYYANLARRIKNKFVKKFVSKDGIIKGDTQAGYAIALHFNLLPNELRPKAVNNMIKAIEKYDRRISTGFCTTLPMMLELTRWGHNNVAYELFLSRKFPSWFYMIEQGATTMWERWDGYVKGRGFQNKMMNSFNHYAYGSVGEWVFKTILGIDLDENRPGYKHITIRPWPCGSITWAKGHYDSIRGKIAISWALNGENFKLEVSIPPNTTATVFIPAKNAENVTENGNLISDSEDLKFVKYENNNAIYEIASGKFNFSSRFP
ncbi:MAG: glycoside hydrolase family 78 protein [Candidatus Helarchaeota archaeon]